MPYYQSDSREYAAYWDGWNGTGPGWTYSSTFYSGTRSVQTAWEIGLRDSEANHGFGNCTLTSDLDKQES